MSWPRDWRLAILGLYALIIGGVMVDLFTLDSLAWVPIVLLFFAFAVGPVALLCVIEKHAVAHGLGAIVIGVYGGWIIVDTMYLAAPDAQSALVFLIMPTLQYGAVLVYVGLVVLGAAILRRRGNLE